MRNSNYCDLSNAHENLFRIEIILAIENQSISIPFTIYMMCLVLCIKYFLVHLTTFMYGICDKRINKKQ